MVDVRTDKLGAFNVSIMGGSRAFTAGGMFSGGKRFGMAGLGMLSSAISPGALRWPCMPAGD